MNSSPVSESLFDPVLHATDISPCLHTPLPMSRQEMDDRGWDVCDIVLITGDAYVDHPSFGVPLIGRLLEWLGYRVGIIAQPLHVDEVRALGRPHLCWGISAGNLDSNLMRQTIMRRPRSDDAYAPHGKAGLRPANASIAYTSLARQAYKGVPVILGGVEASLRRFAYYDYWTEKVRRALSFDAKADLLVYGMGELAMATIAHHLRTGLPLTGIPGTAEIAKNDVEMPHISLPSFEEVSATTPAGKKAFTHTAREIYQHSDFQQPTVLTQAHGDRYLVVNPPARPLATDELDLLYTLPFTRKPHPVYQGARIPAYEMIKDSVTTHRGCYSGCSFCALSAHQGMTISARSKGNIIAEVTQLAETAHFSGTISDLGGPTANMYGTSCRRNGVGCREKSCLFPRPCKNLNTDHRPLLSLLRAARNVPGVKHVFVTSGIRTDLALTDESGKYLDELARYHVCGRLKIAPEHIATGTLRAMRKSDPSNYYEFVRQFLERSRRAGKPQQIVEYFLSGHPGCTLADMVELAEYLHRQQITPEQVQDFYPVPLTLAAAMFYTGVHPLTGETLYVPRSEQEKALQRALLLHHKPEFHRKAREALQAAGRQDLIGYGPHCLVPPERSTARQRRPR